MKTFLPLILITALFLPGCGSISPLTVTTETLDSAGNVISKTTETIASASVAKEQTVHKTLQLDTKGYYTAVEKAGAKFEITGYQEYLPKDGVVMMLPKFAATFRPTPVRNIRLPTAPSVHPVWHLGEVVADKGLTYGLADLTAGVLGNAFDAAQTKYYGDYNPQTAPPYIVNPVVIE
jgi:hypothetical protein